MFFLYSFLGSSHTKPHEISRGQWTSSFWAPNLIGQPTDLYVGCCFFLTCSMVVQWLYITYHLLREPEIAIGMLMFFHILYIFCVFFSEFHLLWNAVELKLARKSSQNMCPGGVGRPQEDFVWIPEGAKSSIYGTWNPMNLRQLRVSHHIYKFLYIIYIPAPSKGCQMNPKGCWTDTLLGTIWHPFEGAGI